MANAAEKRNAPLTRVAFLPSFLPYPLPPSLPLGSQSPLLPTRRLFARTCQAYALFGWFRHAGFILAQPCSWRYFGTRFVFLVVGRQLGIVTDAVSSCCLARFTWENADHSYLLSQKSEIWFE